MEHPGVSLIGAPTDVGAGTLGARMGPAALRVAGLAGAIAHFMDPAQMGQRVQQDYTRWGQVIRDKGIAND